MSLPAVWGSRDCLLPACGHRSPVVHHPSSQGLQQAQARHKHVTGSKRRHSHQRSDRLQPRCQHQEHSSNGMCQECGVLHRIR